MAEQDDLCWESECNNVGTTKCVMCDNMYCDGCVVANMKKCDETNCLNHLCIDCSGSYDLACMDHSGIYCPTCMEEKHGHCVSYGKDLPCHVCGKPTNSLLLKACSTKDCKNIHVCEECRVLCTLENKKYCKPCYDEHHVGCLEAIGQGW